MPPTADFYGDVSDAAWDGFWNGAQTGANAVGNAAIDTAWGFVTLGQGEPWEVFDTSGEGYATSYMFARAGFELLAGAGLGAAAQAPGKLGKAAFALDAAGNANTVGRGGYGWWKDGELNFADGVQIVGGAFGFAGNFGGAFSKKGRATGRIGSIVEHALPGALTPIEKPTIIAKVEALLAAKNVKVEIVWNLTENGFDKDSKIIYLIGSESASSARGAFLEELQHLIDDVNRLTPDPIPKKKTLENALFHRDVFERMTENADLFGMSEAECNSLIEWITVEIWEVKGI